jgi:hypothetical protein
MLKLAIQSINLVIYAHRPMAPGTPELKNHSKMVRNLVNALTTTRLNKYRRCRDLSISGRRKVTRTKSDGYRVGRISFALTAIRLIPANID